MSELDAQGEWLPLMDYAIKKGVSLSTLRRYIKANKVQFRIENGRYLIFDDSEEIPPPQSYKTARTDSVATSLVRATSDEASMLQSRLKKTETDLQQAREEIAELKTLIALYEEKFTHPRMDN